MRHTGDLDSLIEKAKDLGFHLNSLRDIDNGHRLKFNGGAVVAWYPSTGRLVFGGPPIEAKLLSEKFSLSGTMGSSNPMRSGLRVCPFVGRGEREMRTNGEMTERREDAQFLSVLPDYLAAEVEKGVITHVEAAEAMGFNDASAGRLYANPWDWRTVFGDAYRLGYSLWCDPAL